MSEYRFVLFVYYQKSLKRLSHLTKSIISLFQQKQYFILMSLLVVADFAIYSAVADVAIHSASAVDNETTCYFPENHEIICSYH